MSPWTEKYRPTSFVGIKGQAEAVAKIKKFVEEYNIGLLTKTRRKKAIILHGPPGTGKTTLAHVAAKETTSEIFELNASDLRNKDKMNEVLKPAVQQRSLIKQNKIILIDEVDGISGYADRGGISELIRIIDESTYPVIITANDIWNKKLSTLRQRSELVKVKELDYKTIRDILMNILRDQKTFLDHNILTTIAIKAKGDLRAAINDLQTAAKMKNPERMTFDERETELDIFNALKMIFKGKPTNETLGVFDSVKMSIDEIILWMEENIPYEYKGEELARAFDRLSKTDVFKGRIYKQQYWRFLVYENILLSYGIASAKKDKTNTGYTSYKKPTRILKIWMHNQKTAKKKSIAIKYARYVHVGQKRALQEFPLIKQIINSNQQIKNELKLSEDEILYLENGKN